MPNSMMPLMDNVHKVKSQLKRYIPCLLKDPWGLIHHQNHSWFFNVPRFGTNCTYYLVSLIFIPIPWILDRPYYQRNDIERVEPLTVYQANKIQNGAMVQERPRIFPRLPNVVLDLDVTSDKVWEQYAVIRED